MKNSWMSWIEDFFEEEEPSFDSLLVVYIRKNENFFGD